MCNIFISIHQHEMLLECEPAPTLVMTQLQKHYAEIFVTASYDASLERQVTKR
jgi:hypothetical protein